MHFRPFQSPSTIEIEVTSLELVPNSSLLKADEAQFLYVEYSFLGYKGHLLETQSLPQPRKANEAIFYRFNQKFVINPEENEKQFKLLKAMLAKHSKEQLKFFVVREPIVGDENDEECEEAG